MATNINVNGASVAIEADPDTPLLWVLREHLGLKGTKYGCGISACGACTVHMDGMPVRSCVLPLEGVGTARITTIEGLESPAARAVRDAWIALDVVQCGYCQSGQIMSAIALLEGTPAPTDEDIDGAMSGNICRCATYLRIRAAIRAAAAALKA
ncbi:MAG: 2Fe-2S iron-sulfur cluster binding domain-containing protein [Alphaproteobacteria bacterium]|nr:2Fe-2S iron-sulfur cluster binding domain-containing protein [Alphaproteobacteria bacterium]